MEINKALFERIKQSKTQLLAVTKYWDWEDTKTIIQVSKEILGNQFLGIGENRTNQMKEKGLYSESNIGCPIHFIGNLQSRQIKNLWNVESIHSLCDTKHADMLNHLAIDRERDFDVFIQIKISDDPHKFGLEENKLEDFLSQMRNLEHLHIKGLSAMGASEFKVKEKVDEFRTLIKLRDRYFPGLKISAGTSRDFEIALEEGIDIVRIGHKLIHERT